MQTIMYTIYTQTLANKMESAECLRRRHFAVAQAQSNYYSMSMLYTGYIYIYTAYAIYTIYRCGIYHFLWSMEPIRTKKIKTAPIRSKWQNVKNATTLNYNIFKLARTKISKRIIEKCKRLQRVEARYDRFKFTSYWARPQ